MTIFEKLQQHPGLYSVEEASVLLGVSTKTIYRRIANNTIKHFRLGRKIKLDGDTLAKYLKERLS